MPSYKFNFMREFYFEESPQTVLSILEQYRDEVNKNLQLVLDTDKKRILIEDAGLGLKLKLKLFKCDEEEEKMAMRFVKVKGDIMEQQKLMGELITYLEEVIIDEEEQE